MALCCTEGQFDDKEDPAGWISLDGNRLSPAHPGLARPISADPNDLRFR